MPILYAFLYSINSSTLVHVLYTNNFDNFSCYMILKLFEKYFVLFSECSWAGVTFSNLYGTSQLQRKRWQWKKDQRPRSNSGPMLYRRVSATRATETSQGPLSSIALMYRLQVCRYPATLKTAPRGWYCVLCDGSRLSAPSMLHEFASLRWKALYCPSLPASPMGYYVSLYIYTVHIVCWAAKIHWEWNEETKGWSAG